MFLRVFIGLALACLSLPVHSGERYQIDPEHTYSSFEYLHWGLSLQRGRFDKNSGTIELDLPAKSGALQIEIAADSINTGSEVFNKVLRSDNFFDVEKYPKIVFTSDKLIFNEEQLTQIEGQLTIKDITRPVTVQVTYFNCRFMLLYLKHSCGANGYTRILRSDYNVGRYVPFVSDEVTLFFSVEGIKE
ncbi:MAG: YceI family protein [Burkholderiales bacterium]|nr:YceI family protein [Burkholderiales bacterium]